MNVRRRKWQHLNRMRACAHRNFILQRMFNVHGEDVFEFYVIEDTAVEMLAEREQWFIKHLAPFCNISDAYGSHIHTAQAKEKMREYALNRTAVHTAKIAEANKQRRGKPTGLAGIPTGRVPKSAFQPGLIPWNKKYTAEEAVEKRREWSRENGRKYRERHAEARKEYQRMKSREYRARDKERVVHD